MERAELARIAARAEMDGHGTLTEDLDSLEADWLEGCQVDGAAVITYGRLDSRDLYTQYRALCVPCVPGGLPAFAVAPGRRGEPCLLPGTVRSF